jgi:hypothetical protein
MVSPFVGLNLSHGFSDNDVGNIEATNAFNFGLTGRQDTTPPSGVPMSNLVTVGIGYQHIFEHSDYGLGVELFGSHEVSPNITNTAGSNFQFTGGLRFGFGAINPRRGLPVWQQDR